jgi:hypothetical protein
MIITGQWPAVLQLMIIMITTSQWPAVLHGPADDHHDHHKPVASGAPWTI